MNNESDEEMRDPKPTPSAAPEAAGHGGAIREILGGFAASLGFARSGHPKPVEETIDTKTALST